MKINESIVQDEHIEENDTTDTKFRISFWHLFLCNFIFLLICYLPNLQMRFSVDTYLRISDLKEDLFFHLKDGRIVSYLITKMQHIFKIPSSANQQLYFFIFIALLSLCICVLTRLAMRFMDNKSMISMILVDFSFTFGFVNVLMQEYFCFPETYLQYGVGMAFTVLSLYIFLTVNKQIFRILLSGVLLFLSLGSYQIFIQAWLILAITFVLLKHKLELNKNFFGDISWLFGIFATSILTTILTLKILQMTKTVSITRGITLSNVLVRTKYILRSICSFFMHPVGSVTGIALWIIVVVLILECFCLLEKLLSEKISLLKFSIPVLLVMFGLSITFGMHIFIKGIWLVPRVLTGLGFVISSLLLFLINESSECPKKIL